MQSYTYLLTHKRTGKRYYGVRTGNKVAPADDLWINYFSSSKDVKEIITDEGLDSFDYEIRRTFDSRDAALLWEDKFLRRAKVINNPQWFNNRVGLSFSEQVHIANRERTRKRNLQTEFRSASSLRRSQLNNDPNFKAFAQENMRNIVAKLKAEGKTSERTAKGWTPERRAKRAEQNRLMNANPEFKAAQRRRQLGRKKITLADGSWGWSEPKRVPTHQPS